MKSVKKKRGLLLCLLTLVLLFATLTPLQVSAAGSAGVSYRTHVQNDGWQGYVKNGQMSGTEGRSLRLEGINIKLENQDYSGGIEYRTHVQNIGWQRYVGNGVMSGTSGKSLRLEAIQIRLTGEMAQHYDVYYRVHAQNVGWMGWAKNNEPAGTAGYAYRLEGIQIRLIPKGGSAPGNTSNAYRRTNVEYRTHVQNVGWQGTVSDGATSGTSGQSLRLEGICINLPNPEYGGGIEYRTHVQNVGWQNYVSNGAMSGTSGQSLRLEGIQIRLMGEMAQHYDVYYRVHAQNFGWMGWAKNDEPAGTEGYSYRLEGIQIRLVQKGGSAPGSTENAFSKKSNDIKLTDGKWYWAGYRFSDSFYCTFRKNGTYSAENVSGASPLVENGRYQLEGNTLKLYDDDGELIDVLTYDDNADVFHSSMMWKMVEQDYVDKNGVYHEPTFVLRTMERY